MSVLFFFFFFFFFFLFFKFGRPKAASCAVRTQLVLQFWRNHLLYIDMEAIFLQTYSFKSISHATGAESAKGFVRRNCLIVFVRLFDLCLFGFVGFLFLLVSGTGCGLWLWHSLDFSLTFCYFIWLWRSYLKPLPNICFANSKELVPQMLLMQFEEEVCLIIIFMTSKQSSKYGYERW